MDDKNIISKARLAYLDSSKKKFDTAIKYYQASSFSKIKEFSVIGNNLIDMILNQQEKLKIATEALELCARWDADKESPATITASMIFARTALIKLRGQNE